MNQPSRIRFPESIIIFRFAQYENEPAGNRTLHLRKPQKLGFLEPKIIKFLCEVKLPRICFKFLRTFKTLVSWFCKVRFLQNFILFPRNNIMDLRGIEPRAPRCKRGILPLDYRPLI